MGKSSKDKRDAYYRLAKEQGWRARSAFKLIQLDEEFDLFSGVTRVVDLCAAPGSWSQVLSRVLIKGESFGRKAWDEKRRREHNAIHGDGEDEDGPSKAEGQDGQPQQQQQPQPQPKQQEKAAVKIVAIDLQPMAPLDGITMLQGDITASSTIPRILGALDSSGAGVDLVLCDGAPDVTGLHDFDAYIQSQLLFAALQLAARVLRPGPGAFVAKVFRVKDVDLLYAQLRILFDRVVCAKPRSSRASSVEAFVVCRGFKGVPEQLRDDWGIGGGEAAAADQQDNVGPPERQTRTLRDDGVTLLEFPDDDDEDGDQRRWIAPFLACGDLSAWDDADATYHLPDGRLSLDPVQPPTNPPYKRALEMRRRQGGAFGKTKKG